MGQRAAFHFALLVAAALTPLRAAIPISQFSTGSAQTAAVAIAAGADGNLWFLEPAESKVGRMSPAGVVTGEFAVTSNAFLSESTPAITLGPDGNVWFTEPGANAVGSVTPAGKVTEYPILISNAEPVGIVGGPDGNVWFSEYSASRIGRITPAGSIMSFPTLTPSAAPSAMTVGPDGSLWFTEGIGKIGRITTTGSVTEPGSGLMDPIGITAGPDGNLWFTQEFQATVGRMTTSGTVTEFPITKAAMTITAGRDGRLWFVEPQGNAVGAITTGGVVSEQAVGAGSQPDGSAPGPDGNIWFTEPGSAMIGRAAIGCVAGNATVCIDDQPGDKRWQVNVYYAGAEGGGVAGNGNAISLASLGVGDGGLFWFFSAANPELLVKVLNGCGVNQSFWVFTSATTNVGFTLTVTDTETGRTKSYTNPDGKAAVPVQDTSAFACARSDAAGDGRSAGAAETANTSSAPTTCANGPESLCINGRFLITVDYDDAQTSGAGSAIALSSLGVAQGGLFWFFQQANPEMLIKVLDGCALNSHWWVFYAAATNVGFTVTVKDLSDSRHRVYTNKLGVAAPPLQDTSAFACP